MTNSIAVENCKLRQKFLLALVASRVSISEEEHYRRLETPLIYIFSKLAHLNDMAHMPCGDCPGYIPTTQDAMESGEITVWTIQVKPPKPVIQCESKACINVLEPKVIVKI